MEQTQLHIAEPCHENWEAMLAAERGRFCLSCQKTVVDFSSMTDQAVLQYLQQAQGNTCGRFAPDQLNRPMAQEAPVRKRFWAKWVLQLLFPAFVFTQKARAQGFVSILKIPPPAATALHQKPQQAAPFSIKGQVTDSVSGKPIAFASIQVKGSSVGTQTDDNGHFTIVLAAMPKQLQLVASSVGYTNQEASIKDVASVQNILLSPISKDLAEVVVVGNTHNRIIYRYTTGMVSVVADSIVSTKKNMIQRVADSLTGSNQIRLYPNPVNRGNAIQLDMKKVKKDTYRLLLFSASGSLVQQEQIAVPAANFNFNWALGSQLASGNYWVQVRNAKDQAVYSSPLTVL